jgi:uncharacterized protein YdeI (BOF family)
VIQRLLSSVSGLFRRMNGIVFRLTAMYHAAMTMLTLASRLVVFTLVPFILIGCDTDDDSQTTGGPAPAEPVTIAAARAQTDSTTALVEGYVTVTPSTFSSSTGEKGFAIADDTGGIYVSVSEAVTVNLGVKVRVEGKLGQLAQLRILEASAAAVTIESGTKDISPRAVMTGDVNESVEGLLVRTGGTITKPVGDDTPYGFKVFIDDGSGEVQIFVNIVDGSPVIDTASLMPDQTIEVTGLAAQYETTYEVMPRKADDLVLE